MEDKIFTTEDIQLRKNPPSRNSHSLSISKKYKPYPRYKPSGVEWIGEIPEGWDVRRLTTVLKSLESGGREKDSLEIDDGALSIGGEHIGWQGELLIDNPRYISLNYYNSLNKGKVQIKDVLLVKDGATIGKTAYVNKLPKITALNEHVFLMRGKSEIKQKYLFYFVFSQLGQEQIKLSITGSAQPGLNRKFVLFSYLPLPPLPEQQAIAAFLDRETERINTIINKQTRMIELLKEKRSALITQAVTKGLYGLVSATDAEFAQWAKPVKYKPSGVDWNGEIPEGWDVRRFCFLFSFSKGLNITKEDLLDNGIPCINYGEIHSKYGFEVNPKIHLLKCVKNDYLAFSPKSLLYYGDFIFADTSEDIEGSGNFTYFNSIELTCAGYHTIIAKPKYNFDYRYIAYQFDSISFRTQIRSRVSGIKVYSITKAILRNTIVLLPPLPEQQAIAAFLDRETGKIDSLIKKIQKQIDLLNEYKQSLITHVVTGKIDVRDTL